MRFAQMRGGARYTKEVTGLNGGLNTGEPPALLDDRALPDCENVYWKEGVLCTRPALSTVRHNIYDWQDWVISTFETADSEYLLIHTNLWLLVYYKGALILEEAIGIPADVEQHSFFVENGRGNVLLFTDFIDPENNNVRDVWLIELSEMNAAVKCITTQNPYYVPTVFINGRGSIDRFEKSSMTMAEGFNLLTDRYRGYWTTDGEAMWFRPPFKPKSGDFKVEYTHTDGQVYTFTAWVDVDGSYQLAHSAIQNIPDVGDVYLQVSRYGGEFAFFRNDPKATVALPGVGSANNLKVEGSSPFVNRAAVFDMSFSTWFGGDRDSLGSGTRLFLSGNRNEPHIVRYSDVDNPLYFPENNFMYVGDPSQAVTAFGKQNGALVIFKERELYACEYAYRGINETAFVNGEEIDLTATAYFPLTQIHAAVGCDRPRTVRLCGNRLVWAHSDGAVYMLSALSGWSEKAVRCISHAVAPSLRGKAADAAAVYHGNYLLFFDEEVYLFDYMAGAFTGFTSYADERRAASGIPWYRWRLPLGGTCCPLGRDDALMMFVITEEGALTASRFDEGACDRTVGGEDVPIFSRVVTKPFSLGHAGERGAVYALRLQLGCTGSTLDVTLQGDGTDTTPTPHRLQVASGDARDIAPVSVPCRQTRVRTLGLTVESTDPLVLAGLSMEYRIWKGV